MGNYPGLDETVQHSATCADAFAGPVERADPVCGDHTSQALGNLSGIEQDRHRDDLEDATAISEGRLVNNSDDGGRLLGHRQARTGGPHIGTQDSCPR
jgi:hypothetical protein